MLVRLIVTSLPGAVASLVLTAAFFADAQPPAKLARIGILTLAVASSAPLAEAFRQGLREHGYMEGQNIALEYRYAEGRAERLPALAAELVHLKVDVIVTESNVAPLAAKRATKTIPIVMAIAGDPVHAGVVASLARPGGNVTGLTLIHPELSGKRLQLLKEAVPSIALVAVIWNPTDPPAVEFLRETEAAARSLGLRLHVIEARAPAELDSAFKAAAGARPSAFFTLPGGMFQDNQARVVEFAKKHRLPGVFPSRVFVEAGGLMSYGPNLAVNARRAAAFVDKVLKGAKPADLPIEQPTKFELVLNLKTARALGLTIPVSMLTRADHVIE
jgi:putative ABC transport system substrate-binding protein